MLAIDSACGFLALDCPRSAASAPTFERPHTFPNPSLNQARVKALAITAVLTTPKTNIHFIEAQITSTFPIENLDRASSPAESARDFIELLK